MSINNYLDWPTNIRKPILPDAYEWVCLRPALGMQKPDGSYPYWIRAKEKSQRGRFVKIRPEYFDTPQMAVNAAVKLMLSLDRVKKGLVT